MVMAFDRQLRELARWAAAFKGRFRPPSEGESYYYWRIPAPSDMVEGSETTPAIQARCAQLLIDAAGHIARAKPKGLGGVRVTAGISLPGMFMSDVCIFYEEAFYQRYIRREIHPNAEYQRWTPLPKERSLAREMGLVLPPGFGEIGFHDRIDDRFHPVDFDALGLVPVDDVAVGGIVEGEEWFFGDVADQPT